jgi:hypothetical protein
MGGKRLPSCRHCGCKFRPDVYNRHHQQWCSKPECRRARDRERKRRYYLLRLQHEEGFRESERRRCREAMRRLRSRTKQDEAEGATAVLPSPSARELLIGLVSQLADTTDPLLVGQVMNRYAERGRRLAVAPCIRGSP